MVTKNKDTGKKIVRLSVNRTDNPSAIRLKDADRVEFESSVEICPVYKSVGGRVIDDMDRPFEQNSPIEEYMMMQLSGISPKELDYHRRVNVWLGNYGFKVTSKQNVDLDITTTKKKVTLISTGQEVEIDAPNVPSDYFNYHVAKKSPLVAKNAEQIKNSSMFPVIMLDEAEEKKIANESTDIGIKADEKFTKLISDVKGNKGKIEAVFNMTKLVTDNIDTDDEYKTYLFNLKKKDAAKFIAYFEIPNLETKGEIYKLVEYRVMNLDKGSYSFKDLSGNDKILGNLEDAVKYFLNPNNTDITVLRANLENTINKNKI